MQCAVHERTPARLGALKTTPDPMDVQDFALALGSTQTTISLIDAPEEISLESSRRRVSRQSW